MQGPRRVAAISAAIVCVAFTVAACGSSSSNSSSAGSGGSSTAGSASGSTSTTSPGVSQANAQLAAWAPANPSVAASPLGKPAPHGKTVDYVTCPVTICVEVGQGVQAAGKALGWTVHVLSGGLTPATFTSAWDQIAQNPPDAVVGVGLLPTTAIAKQLDVLKAKNIPYVSVTSPNPPGNGLTGVVSGTPEVQRSGTLLADWVVSNSAGSANDSVYVYDPSDTSIAPAYTSYKQRMSQLCSSCNVAALQVSAADIGTKIPAQVVSYVQSHPSLRYVVMGLGDLAAGVPEALKAAGLLSQVKVITRVITPTNFDDVANGLMTAGFTEESYEVGWLAIDMVLRKMVGDPLASTQPIAVIHLITDKNLPSNLKQPYVVPGYEQAYETAWGLTK